MWSVSGSDSRKTRPSSGSRSLVSCRISACSRSATASRQNVFALIVGHGAKLAAAGILFGVAGAAAATRVITSILYNVGAGDPVSFIGTAVFLVLVALAASYIPARRATAVDPMVALR